MPPQVTGFRALGVHPDRWSGDPKGGLAPNIVLRVAGKDPHPLGTDSSPVWASGICKSVFVLDSRLDFRLKL